MPISQHQIINANDYNQVNICAAVIRTRELHGNGDGGNTAVYRGNRGNTADFPFARCGNTAGME